MHKLFSALILYFTLVSYSSVMASPQKKSIILHKKITKGDSLNRILLKAGFPQKAINTIISNYKQIKFVTLSPKQVYTINKNSQTRSLSIYQDHSKKLQFTYDTKTKKVTLNKVHDGLKTRLEKINGRIYGSIYSSLMKKVNDPLIPYKFQDIFLLYYDLKKQILPGAEYSFVIEKKYSQGKFIKYGQIAEAELQLKNKLIRRVLVKNGKTHSYIGREEEGKRPFYSPVDYQHFTSLYKKRRFHPVRKRYMAHHGIDFGLPEGRSVYAVSGGTIIKAGFNRIAGHYVAIRHKKGYVSYYNHLVKRHKNIKLGLKVKAGDTLGWIGCSGSCTKPHLHFAIKHYDKYKNPIHFIKSYPFRAKDSVTKISKKFQ